MLSEIDRWRNKIALVTGASSGIGKAIAADLAISGLRVWLVARDRARLEETAARIRDAGGTAEMFVGDLGRRETIEHLFATIRAAAGGVDVLVNNAGIGGGESLIHAETERMQAVLDLNIHAPLWCMREAVRDMRRTGHGAIINISSLAGHRVKTGGSSSLYAATKHALRILTDGLRFELAREKSTIKVAAISPGMVDTPFHDTSRRKEPYAFAPLSADAVVAAVRYILSTPVDVQVSDVLLRSSEQDF